MKLATAFIEMRADRAKLKRDLDGVEADTRKTADGAGKLFAQLFGAAAFGAGIKKSIDAASDLNETVSKTKVLFGDDANAVVEFGKTTAKSMGLSQRAYLDAASGLKGLLDNLGLAPQQATEWSQKLTQLGSDLGSFFNKDPAEAVAAIGSAMRGESEPIRAFNVQINEAAIKTKAMTLGLWDGKGAIDSNAKAQATLALIMAQTTAAQGDFARTADGAANSQRIAKATMEDSAASLGQAFLPVYTRVVKIVTLLAETFGNLPAPVQVGVIALGGLVAMSGPISHVIDITKSFGPAISKMSAVSVAGFGALAVAGGLALFAIERRLSEVAATKAFETARVKLFSDALLKGATAADALNLALNADTGTIDWIDLGTVKDLTGVLARAGLSWDEFRNHLLGTKEAFAAWVLTSGQFGRDAGVEGSRLKMNDVNALYQAGTQLINEHAVAQQHAIDLARIHGTALDGERHGLDGAMEANAALAKSVDDVASKEADVAAAKDADKTATADLTAVLKDSRTEFDDLASAADSLRKALDAVFGGTQTLEEADRALRNEVDATKQSIKDHGKSLDINTDKGRANREQVEKHAKAIVDYGVAMVGSGKSNQEAADNIAWNTAVLRDQLVAAGMSKSAVEEYIKTLGLTPENVRTAIQLVNDETAKNRLADIQAQLGDIDAGAAANIKALVDQGKFDEAEAMLLRIAKERNIKVNLVPGTGLQIGPISGGGRLGVTFIAQGGKFDRPTPVVIGEDGTEVALPLTKPSRLAALLADPSIRGPIAAAMGDSGSSVATAGSGQLFSVGTINGSEAMRQLVETRLSELAAEIMAGRLN